MLRAPFGNSAGTAAISQTFACDDPLGCTVSVDYKLHDIDASTQTGRVRVLFNGDVAFVSPPTDFQD